MHPLNWIVAIFLVTASTPLEASELPLKFGGRQVDLAPYYFEFPYSIKAISLKNEKIYYSKDTPAGGSRLFVQTWDPSKLFKIDSENASPVTGINLGKINFWRRAYNEALDGLVVAADEDKGERTNLWLFSDRTSKPVKLTNADYIYNFTQSEDGRTIAYLTRYGSSDHSEGCLEILNIGDNREVTTRKLLCDSENRIQAKLNWWAGLRFDEQGIVFTALADGDRKKQELYHYSMATGAASMIVSGHGSSWMSVLSEWREPHRFLFVRDQDLFVHDLASGRETHLRKFKNSVSGSGTLTNAGRQFFYIVTRDIADSTFELFYLDGDELHTTAKFESPTKLSVLDTDADLLILFKQSAGTLLDFETVRIDEAGAIERSQMIAGIAGINDRLANCNVSPVKYSYLDEGLDAPDKRDVDAYLYEPRDEIAPDKRLFVIEAFYGGKNRFTRGFHSLCKVGITTLSPVVRGDNRFGAKFEQSNDGENADAPIRDVLAGARYLQSKFALADGRRIGTFGYSHGGWAAVRSVSYPGKGAFGFGFALAGAGYFDFLQIADEHPDGQTNIRGWIEKEFGNMNSQRDHLSRISPSAHVDRIQVPVFLFHGRNDERISVRHSISFAKKLEQSGVPHRLVIVEAQGHSITGAKNWHQIYGAMFEFLDTVNEGLNQPR